jgi:manganese/zinc/iron transport system permease protein
MTGLGWTAAVDGWIVAIAALAAIACAIPGSFLVMRRESMLADAISHGVLPGLAAAFLVTGTRSAPAMAAGALVAAIVLSAGWRAIAASCRVERGAALGIAYTVMFAAGVVLLVRAADRVDLDPSCVLFGSLELAPLDDIDVLGTRIPFPALLLAGVAAANATVAALLWPMLVADSFDRGFARVAIRGRGIAPVAMSAMSAVTCVACFEAVGSILVVAMLVTPAVIARLLADSMRSVVAIAAAAGIAAAGLGHLAATALPRALGLAPSGVRDVSTAGSIAVMLGILLAVTVLVDRARRAPYAPAA